MIEVPVKTVEIASLQHRLLDIHSDLCRGRGNPTERLRQVIEDLNDWCARTPVKQEAKNK